MQVCEVGFLLGGLICNFVHRRLNGARKDGIDSDVLRPVLRGEDLRQTDQSGFAGRVSCDTGKTDRVADKRAREDNGALTLLQHCRDLVLGGEERARQIDLERFVPAAERNTLGWSLLAEYAGIVEGDIKPTVALLRTLHQFFGECLIADITSERESGASTLGNLADKRLQFRLATRRDHHLSTRTSK